MSEPRGNDDGHDMAGLTCGVFRIPHIRFRWTSKSLVFIASRFGSGPAFQKGVTHGTQTPLTLLVAAAALSIRAAAQEQTNSPAPQQRIVISIPDRKLALIERDETGMERVLRIYDIAVGKPSTPSPNGTFHVVNRLKHPTWFNSGRVVPPGPSNPLGTRWLGLSKAGYGIHGTNAPLSIGLAASHGCIRMRNQDVEELFELVSVGATVELAGQRPPIFRRMIQFAD